MPRPVVVASLMRPQGTTGVQTHTQQFLSYLHSQRSGDELLTPYSRPRWQVYPAFALRRLIDPLSGSASVWWYRVGHALFLRHALAARLGNGEPAVIYAQCPVSANAALEARCSASQRVVMVVHFNVSQAMEWQDKGFLDPSDWVYRQICKLESTVLPKLDGLVFVSRFMRDTLRSRVAGLDGVPQEVLPNFVRDPGALTNQPAVRDLVAIGTLEPRKNQGYLLEVLAAANQLGSRLTLTLIGDGPDSAALQSRASALGVGAQVEFSGFVPNAAERIGEHRACIHAARLENLPLVLIEAQSRGRPVFSTPAGGATETFEEQVSGVAIPLDNASEAAKRIVSRLNDKDWMTRASLAARERFLQHYESTLVAGRLLHFLEGV